MRQGVNLSNLGGKSRTLYKNQKKLGNHAESPSYSIRIPLLMFYLF